MSAARCLRPGCHADPTHDDMCAHHARRSAVSRTVLPSPPRDAPPAAPTRPAPVAPPVVTSGVTASRMIDQTLARYRAGYALSWPVVDGRPQCAAPWCNERVDAPGLGCARHPAAKGPTR